MTGVILMIAAPFYGEIFSAIGQISVKSLMPILFTTVGVGS